MTLTSLCSSNMYGCFLYCSKVLHNISMPVVLFLPQNIFSPSVKKKWRRNVFVGKYEITFENSVGNGSHLWGGYVTGCHWMSDLEVNSCSSGIMCFHWQPLIWNYKPSTNFIEQWRYFYTEIFHFSLKVKSCPSFESHGIGHSSSSWVIVLY